MCGDHHVDPCVSIFGQLTYVDLRRFTEDLSWTSGREFGTLIRGWRSALEAVILILVLTGERVSSALIRPLSPQRTLNLNLGFCGYP